MSNNSHRVLEAKTTEGENIALLSVSVSYNGRLVSVGCSDSIIRIWDVQTGYLVERLRGHGDYVRSVAFTLDNRSLISGSDDEKVKRWDLTPFLECEARLDPLPPAMSSASMPTSASGRGASVPAKGIGERGSICTLTFDGHIDWVRVSAVSHDGQWVVSGSRDEKVLFWDARNAQAQFALHGHGEAVLSADVSPTRDVFATADQGGTIRICELSYSIWGYRF